MELTRSQEAAAFHGLALNMALSTTERLELALRALELYEAELLDMRERQIHQVSQVADAFGGYMCACGRSSFSHKYGCLASEKNGDT